MKMGVCFFENGSLFYRKWEFVFSKMGVCFFENVSLFFSKMGVCFFENGSLFVFSKMVV